MSDTRGSETPDKESQSRPNKRKRGHRRADSNLQENRNDLQLDKMSSRNRSGRGSNRNNSNNDQGEEVGLWDSIKSSMAEALVGVNAESEGLKKIVEMDKQMGAMDPEKLPNADLKEMEQLCRSGVKMSEENFNKVKDVYDKLSVLRAVVAPATSSGGGTAKRGATKDNAAAAASLYDFDANGDSPVPSPIGSSSTRKFGERSSTRDRERDKDRDSIPPKQESVEPQGGASTPLASGPRGLLNKSKVTFSKGETVAYKPKPDNNEATPDWILAEVAQVLGEGKSRRYKVIDVEPDDHSKQKEYRTSASSMIPITPDSQSSTLPDWDPNTIVLALYPNTTTFYKAEVHSMDEEGRVNLKFEGENDSSTLQQVERRFVIEYRP